MRKKILLLFLTFLILLSSLLVSVSAASTDTRYCALPLSVRWKWTDDAYQAPNQYLTIPLCPTTYVYNDANYVYDLNGFYVYNLFDFDDYSVQCRFDLNGDLAYDGNVYFECPYAFGSANSFFNITFDEYSDFRDDIVISYSYYITSDNEDTRRRGEFVEGTVSLADLDAGFSPFEDLMVWYGANYATIFISQFQLTFSCDNPNWSPDIRVFDYYDDLSLQQRVYRKLEMVFADNEPSSDAYDAGYLTGYENGFADGASGGMTFTQWLGSALSGFFNNFSFGGFNLGVIFFLIIAILLILAVIKMFSK